MYGVLVHTAYNTEYKQAPTYAYSTYICKSTVLLVAVSHTQILLLAVALDPITRNLSLCLTKNPCFLIALRHLAADNCCSSTFGPRIGSDPVSWLRLALVLQLEARKSISTVVLSFSCHPPLSPVPWLRADIRRHPCRRSSRA